MSGQEIIAQLPYTEPFLFVDTIDRVTEKMIEGSYTFSKDAFFYKGHFKNNPVTPGVIITECMAQIGLVSLGVYKLKDKDTSTLKVAFTSAEVDFLKPVFPEERVTVTAQEIYFRFNKLKCKVVLKNDNDEVCAQGDLAGVFSVG